MTRPLKPASRLYLLAFEWSALVGSMVGRRLRMGRGETEARLGKAAPRNKIVGTARGHCAWALFEHVRHGDRFGSSDRTRTEGPDGVARDESQYRPSKTRVPVDGMVTSS